MNSQVCIHIVDDDEAVRRTLAYAVASAGFASRVYGSAEQLIATAAGLAPGCIVTDVRMPGLDGVTLVRRLRALAVPHPIIVISGQADIRLAVDAMKAGAAEFLEKPLRPAALIETVQEVMRTDAVQAGPQKEVARYRRMLSTLSRRQRDVLDGILEGKLNKTIAHELGISVRTVEGYRAEMMAKTQARNLSELIRMAVLAGL